MSKTRYPLTAVPAKVACERLGVSADTLRRWAKAGLIGAQRTPAGHFRYNLEEYLAVVAELEGEERRGGASEARVWMAESRES
jgi:excisionase family DNA binding protein